MEFNQERIEAAIVAEVVSKVITDDEIWNRAKRAIDERINKHFVDKADAQIAAAVEEAIKSGFDREYQRVSAWGEQSSPKTTIRKELEKLIGDYWNTKVDRQGKPSTGYGADTTRAEYVMMQMVASDFQGAMKQHVVNLGGGLKDHLRASLHETVNELLSGVFKVNSQGDQEIKKAGSNRTGSAIIDPPSLPIA